MGEISNGRSLASSLETVRSELDQGLLPLGIYGDPEIFELEMERLFSKVWLFIGHESEIPNPGDYVLRNLARDSFIFVRGRDGEIRLLLNTCRHRGMKVCRAERGNTPTFRCPNHGWIYNNTGELWGVPAIEEAYGNSLDRSKWSLVAAPKLDQYNGLYFASLDPNAPPLSEHLGGMRWYLDILTKRSDAGMAVVGGPRRWVINANWKMPADNFVGDVYHTGYIHDSIMEVGLTPKNVDVPMWCSNISVPNGHGVWMNGAEPGVSLLSLRGYPESLIRSMKRNLLPDQFNILDRAPHMGGQVFPNLAYMDVAMFSYIDSPPAAYSSIRIWQPIAPDRTEIWTWFLVEKDTPDDFKQASYNSYMRNFGPSGNFEQDDVEVWCGVTQSAKGVIGRNLRQNLSIGVGKHQEFDRTFKGPGDAIIGAFCEANQRGFYRNWLRYLTNQA
jgi:phenylpropionate dioxygenase-like ring-hydroxylating dioxygenase large terminal subunit